MVKRQKRLYNETFFEKVKKMKKTNYKTSYFLHKISQKSAHKFVDFFGQKGQK